MTKQQPWHWVIQKFPTQLDPRAHTAACPRLPPPSRQSEIPCWVLIHEITTEFHQLILINTPGQSKKRKKIINVLFQNCSTGGDPSYSAYMATFLLTCLVKIAAHLLAMTKSEKNCSGKATSALLVYFWKQISEKPLMAPLSKVHCMSGTLAIRNKTPMGKKKRKRNDWERAKSSCEWDSLGVSAICLIFIGHIPQKSARAVQIPLHFCHCMIFRPWGTMKQQH